VIPEQFTYVEVELQQKRSIFVTDKPIHSSERMLHKDYDCKDSVGKTNFGRELRGVWRQGKLTARQS
jgi:hypothetical protein